MKRKKEKLEKEENEMEGLVTKETVMPCWWEGQPTSQGFSAKKSPGNDVDGEV